MYLRHCQSTQVNKSHGMDDRRPRRHHKTNVQLHSMANAAEQVLHFVVSRDNRIHERYELTVQNVGAIRVAVSSCQRGHLLVTQIQPQLAHRLGEL